MKSMFFVISLFIPSIVFGQLASFKESKKWKLYDIADENSFQYSLDTLKKFSYLQLSDDTILSFMTELSELPSGGPHVWMGAYIATFEWKGMTKKVEISHYGGIIYDEESKKHYQISEEKIQEWLAYIRKTFMAIHEAKQ